MSKKKINNLRSFILFIFVLIFIKTNLKNNSKYNSAQHI